MANLLPNVYQRSSETGPVADQKFRDWQTDSWRQAFEGDVQQFGQRREPYYEALQSQFQGAYTPMAQRAEKDSQQQRAFASARTGTAGGSADWQGQADIQQQLASRLAEIATKGRQIATDQRGRDSDAMQAWMRAGYQTGPGELLAHQSELDASRARSGQTQQLTQTDATQFQNRQAYQALMSQLIGSQLSNTGDIFNTAGQLGVGPQAIQNWGNAMTDPGTR